MQYLHCGGGKIEKNGFVDENPDFTADSGFTEVCVEINDRTYCGFGKVKNCLLV